MDVSESFSTCPVRVCFVELKTESYRLLTALLTLAVDAMC